MGGPKASLPSGNISSTASAITWAVECRSLYSCSSWLPFPDAMVRSSSGYRLATGQRNAHCLSDSRLCCDPIVVGQIHHPFMSSSHLYQQKSPRPWGERLAHAVPPKLTGLQQNRRRQPSHRPITGPTGVPYSCREKPGNFKDSLPGGFRRFPAVQASSRWPTLSGALRRLLVLVNAFASLVWPYYNRLREFVLVQSDKNSLATALPVCEVGDTRLELVTSTMSTWRSSHLS